MDNVLEMDGRMCLVLSSIPFEVGRDTGVSGDCNEIRGDSISESDGEDDTDETDGEWMGVVITSLDSSRL